MNSFESFEHKEENSEPKAQEKKSWLQQDTEDLQEQHRKERELAAKELERCKKIIREKFEEIRKRKLLEDLSKKSKH